MEIKEYIVVSSLEVERGFRQNELTDCYVFYSRVDAEEAALQRSKDSIAMGYFARFLVFEATHQTDPFANGEVKLSKIKSF